MKKREKNLRKDLKRGFDLLRQEVPTIKDYKKTSKITILTKAKEYTDELKIDETRLLTKLAEDQRKNEELLNRC